MSFPSTNCFCIHFFGSSLPQLYLNLRLLFRKTAPRFLACALSTTIRRYKGAAERLYVLSQCQRTSTERVSSTTFVTQSQIDLAIGTCFYGLGVKQYKMISRGRTKSIHSCYYQTTLTIYISYIAYTSGLLGLVS